MPVNKRLPVSEISEMLRASAEEVARRLLPGGRLDGHEWHCKGKDSPNGETISVHVGQGAKRGVVGFWNSARKGGDLIDLAEEVLGTDTRGAVGWAKSFLGLPADESTIDPVQLERRRRQAEEGRVIREANEARERASKQSTAKDIWNESSTDNGGIGFRYLISRGIDPRFVDGELRCHPALDHGEGGRYPALVGRVSAADGQFAGIWRIYTALDGSGKAPVENAKRGLGNAKGGAVRIGGVAPLIGVAEGIETALAARQLVFEDTGKLIPVWAALSAVGIHGLELPPQVHALKIFTDNDPIKFRRGMTIQNTGIVAAEALSERLANEGIAARIIAPSIGQDWLDVLQCNHVGDE